MARPRRHEEPCLTAGDARMPRSRADRGPQVARLRHRGRDVRVRDVRRVQARTPERLARLRRDACTSGLPRWRRLTVRRMPRHAGLVSGRRAAPPPTGRRRFALRVESGTLSVSEQPRERYDHDQHFRDRGPLLRRDRLDRQPARTVHGSLRAAGPGLVLVARRATPRPSGRGVLRCGASRRRPARAPARNGEITSHYCDLARRS